MKLEELIEKFSAAAGIENAPAVEGVWKFSADGNVFGVTGDEHGEKLWLFGEVPFADPAKKDALVKDAMEANFFHRGTGGATFALNPGTGALTLVAAKRLDGLDEEAFYAFVEKFVNTLAVWNGISGTGKAQDDSHAGQSAEPPEDRPPASGFGFMRV